MSITNYIRTRLEEEYHHLNLWYFVSFIFGILAYFAITNEPSTRHITTLVLVSLASLYLRRYGLIYILLSGLLISFTLGLGAAKYRAMNLEVMGLKEQTTTPVIGTVSSIKQTTRGAQVVLENAWIKKHKEITKVRINIKAEHSSSLMIGDRIKVFAMLQPPPRSVLPGGYDFGLYAYFAGLQATGYALSMPKVVKTVGYSKATLGHPELDPGSQELPKILDQDWNGYKPPFQIQSLRHTIYHRLTQTLDPIRGNFAAAILLGEGAGLDRKVMQNMRYSGISHILCVSGLHLSLVAMLFFITSRFLLNLSDRIAFNCNIKVIAAIISLVGSFAYLLLSGTQIAATRAFIMTAIFILSVIIGRSPYPLRSIGVAAVIILSLNPEYVLHPSFQLSFIAVLSLITGYEFYIRNQWILGASGGLFSNIKLYIFSNIYSSLIASLATTPIVIYHFYISSNYSIIANLIAVPIMSFFMMPLAILAVILMPFRLDYYVLKLLGFFIQIVIDLADWVCHLPGAIWYFGYVTPLSVMCYMIGFFWLTLWQRSWRHFGWVLITVSICLMFISPKPDFIYDPKINALGVKNEAGILEIYAKRISGFTKNYWANWFGQADVIVHKEGVALPSDLATYSPWASEATTRGGGELVCGTERLSKKELEKYGTILIFLKYGKCKMVYDRSERFKFR